MNAKVDVILDFPNIRSHRKKEKVEHASGKKSVVHAKISFTSIGCQRKKRSTQVEKNAHRCMM